MQRNVWTNYYPGQPLTAISVDHHRNKAPGVSNKIEPLACGELQLLLTRGKEKQTLLLVGYKHAIFV